MTQSTWPVAVLALITLLAGAIVGDALRAAANGTAQPAPGTFQSANAQP